MKDTNNVTENDTVEGGVTYRDGYHFSFKLTDHTINAFCSAVNGKETIYIDEEAVSTKRSFGRQSRHAFELTGKFVEIEFHIVN